MVYVDDLILVENDISEINNIKYILDAKLSIKDLRNLMYFLGFEISRSSKGIELSQRKYDLDLLQHVGPIATKLVTTPMDPIKNLTMMMINL